MIYSLPRTCGEASLPWTPGEGEVFFPFDFIPPEAGGFLNSRGRTAAPAKRKEKRRRRANTWTHVTAGTSGTRQPERQHQLRRTWNRPSRLLRPCAAASISVSFSRTWELAPPTEIPPYL